MNALAFTPIIVGPDHSVRKLLVILNIVTVYGSLASCEVFLAQGSLSALNYGLIVTCLAEFPAIITRSRRNLSNLRGIFSEIKQAY
jgi:hypothetical protein